MTLELEESWTIENVKDFLASESGNVMSVESAAGTYFTLISSSQWPDPEIITFSAWCALAAIFCWRNYSISVNVGVTYCGNWELFSFAALLYVLDSKCVFLACMKELMLYVYLCRYTEMGKSFTSHRPSQPHWCRNWSWIADVDVLSVHTSVPMKGILHQLSRLLALLSFNTVGGSLKQQGEELILESFTTIT